MTQTGIANVAATSSSADAIGVSVFGGFTNTSLAGYTIEFKNDGSGADDGATTATATLDEAGKKIVVEGSFDANTKPAAGDIQTAIRGLKVVFDGLGKIAQGTEVALITVTNDSTVAGTSLISGGTAAVAPVAAKAEFKVTTGASKTGTVTVTITENIPANGATPAVTNVYTKSVNVSAGQTAATVAGLVATSGTWTPATTTPVTPAANFGVAVDNTKLVITQLSEGPATYTVSVQ